MFKYSFQLVGFTTLFYVGRLMPKKGEDEDAARELSAVSILMRNDAVLKIYEDGVTPLGDYTLCLACSSGS